MKVTFNLRSGIGPITLDLPGDDDKIISSIKAAIKTDDILDLTDVRGDRFVLPASMIGYVLVPTTEAHRVGFGRA